MSDIGMFIVDNCIDLRLTSDGSTLDRDEGLESAVLISLFTDQRVAVSEIPDGDTSQRGWWADLVSEFAGDQIGSKLWTFDRSKVTNETVQAFQTRAKQSLEWMIEDGVADAVEVVASIVSGTIKIVINISRPGDECENRFSMFWDGQNLKRA